MKHSDSPYSRGARSGWISGLLTSLMLVCVIYSPQLPVLSLFCLMLAAALPLAVFRMLRSSYISSGHKCSMSELWVEGIMIFFFGSLICATVTMAFLRWVEPGFILGQATACIDICNASPTPEHQDIARLLQAMIDRGTLPGATDFTIAMFWLTMATGSLLSMILAILARIHLPAGRIRQNATKQTI